MTDGNDSAFAVIKTEYRGDWQIVESKEGCTKREYFAVMAMQGLAASGANDFNLNHCDRVAEIAVKQANALIVELNKD